MTPDPANQSRDLIPVALGYGCSHTKNLARYRDVVGAEAIEGLSTLGERLRGIRICHINSTPFGGGVAELLTSLVPMVRSLGVEIEWRVIHGDPQFFAITKGLHNALQGGDFEFTEARRKAFLDHNRASAQLLPQSYDVCIVNDPQPLPLRHFCSESRAKWIWRCHVDSSSPNAEVWGFLKQYVEEYDAVVFTMDKFVPPDLRIDQVDLIPPAIDPLSAKNMPIDGALAEAVIADAGVDPERPLLLQVSRFDPWKDPMGVIRAYRLVKEKLPDVQLALIGAMAGDDPQGWELFEAISREALQDPDLHVGTNLSGIGSLEVNAFQRAASVVVQKSIKEGFGLVISEALWKGTPVVAGNAGGIPMQMTGELARYLVESVEECAQKVERLLENRDERERIGKAGQEQIRANFLMPRLIRDELTLNARLLGR